MKRMLTVLIAMTLMMGLSIHAADDPSIEGATRKGIQKAMNDHIQANKVDTKYVIYDAVANKLLKLDYDYLHDGIIKKGGFYVSCADFNDNTGTTYDIDILAVEQNGTFKVVDTIVHKVGDEKRTYTLSEE